MWSAKFFFGIKKIVNYDLNLSKLAFKRAKNNFNFISFFFSDPERYRRGSGRRGCPRGSQGVCQEATATGGRLLGQDLHGQRALLRGSGLRRH